MKIRAIRVDPFEEAYEVEIENNLESLQKVVGGLIEVVHPFNDSACIICNEEGKIKNLPLCRYLVNEDNVAYDVICGSFLIVGTEEGNDDFVSLTNEQTKLYLDKYKYIF